MSAEPALVPELALVLGFGLATMRASSEAETVAEAEVWDDDGEAVPDAEPVADGEPAPDGEPDGEAVPDGEPVPDGELDGRGEFGLLLGLVLVLGLGPVLGLGLVLGLVLGAGEVEELEGDGVGVEDFVGVGVGVGVGVLEAGSSWHVVSVFALALVEVPELSEAAVSLIVLARAGAGKLASTPRVRKPPASTLGVTARTRARRMKIALPTLLIRVTVCSRSVRLLSVGFGGDGVTDGYEYSYPVLG